jgi:hypothetical protein
MRRWLSILLLVLLPLQLSWAAAAPYCQHEKSPVALQHFGHHEHEHEDAGGAAAGDSVAVDASQDGGDTKLLTVDHDCAYCQMGSAQAVSATIPAVAVPIGRAFAAAPAVTKQSFICARLERPNWRTA